MAEVYVTLGEAAELEGVKYKTMAQRLSRKKETFVTNHKRDIHIREMGQRRRHHHPSD